MLNDFEFAQMTGIDPTLLSDEIIPFTCFELPLETSDKRHHTLWEVKPITTSEGELDRQEKDAREENRATLLGRYIQRGYAFEAPGESPFPSDEEPDNPQPDDSWDRFWGGESPTEALGIE